MDKVELILLALALSIDALVVAFSLGLVHQSHRFANGLGISTATGLGQLIMPIAGFYLLLIFQDWLTAIDHWIVLCLLAGLGLKWIHGALTNPEPDEELTSQKISLHMLCLLGIATSIDALAGGAVLYVNYSHSHTLESLALPPFVLGAAILIGLTTFVIGGLGFYLSKYLHHIPSKILEIAAGVTLIILGVKTFAEHMMCTVQ